MNARTPELASKAPHMGTNIFTVMSALASEKMRSTWAKVFRIFLATLDCPTW